MVEAGTGSEAREMAIYRPGQKVEIKHRPGVLDTVIAYDPMMVPPITLASDPQPRYPEELVLVTHPSTAFDWLKPWAKVTSNPAISSRRQLVKA